MAKLVLTSPEGQQVVSLADENSLGRHPDSTIQILDKVVSKEHCRVLRTASGWQLCDLGSLNGTFLNGARLEGTAALQHGDEFTLGSTRARFEDDVPTPRPPMAVDNTALKHNQGGFQQQPAQAQALRGGKLQDPTHTLLGSLAPPIDLRKQDRRIGTQIDLKSSQGFRPYEEVAGDPKRLQADYERLRFSHELSREIYLERELPALLDKILASMFRFVRADRGVIFLAAEDGSLEPGASLRRDGSRAAISVSSTIMNHVVKARAAVLTHDAAMDFADSKGKSMILNRISSAMAVPLLHEQELLGVLWLDSEMLAQFEERDLELVSAIAGQAAMFIQISILGRKIEQEIVNRERFSRLLSPNVAEKVLSGEMVIQKGGQLLQDCTVFNSDIRGFTQMSEHRSPEELVETLNEYFELMVETLFKYDGTLDKFMGDGIMALWGAPVKAKDDAERAVECALEQLEVLRRFNLERRDANVSPLEVGIGIHTGPLVAGYIGSSKALSYTVIGDTANTSARLCGAAEGGQILISEQTRAHLGPRFEYQQLPPLHLKGKEKPFQCYAIVRSRFALSIPVAPPNSSRPPSSGRQR